MSSYKEIVGQKITKVSSDPGEPKTGQMWYNSTTGSLRGLGILEAWSSASPVNRASQGGYYGAIGTSTSGLALVGAPGNSSPLETEEWNGTGWSASDNMASYSGISGNMTPSGGASGTVTSALYAGGEMYTGNTRAKAQEYDGSSWTTITDMPQNTGYDVGIGTASNTSIMVGGYDETYAFLNATADWSGSSWTAGGTLGTARWAACGGGTETAAWFSGGKTGSYPGTTTTATENYNGSSWSTGDALNTARWFSGGVGPQTAAMVIGERPSPGPGRGGNTEVYNGTAWTETADLATARVQFKGNAGTSAGAFVAGGSVPPSSSATEEFNKSTNVIIAAAWASGGNLTTARGGIAGDGTKTSAIAVGGRTPPNTKVGNTELYDGTSWTESGDLSTARDVVGAAGTQTATVAFGGYNGSSVQTATEEFGGSTWTGGGSLNTARSALGRAGTQTAGLGFGGYKPGAPINSNATEEYDGSSWTSSNNLNTGRYYTSGFGTQTAAACVGGVLSPGNTNKTEEYDGTSWTEVNNYFHSLFGMASAGTQTSGLLVGGAYPAGANKKTETASYDGTHWSTNPAMATARYLLADAGASSTSNVAFGGDAAPGVTASTEEFTPETETANIADFTTS